MSNLKLWNKVQQTDPKHTKNVTIGARKYTSIDPQYQKKLATEQFGEYGAKWGLCETMYTIIDMPNEAKLLVLDAVFCFPGGNFPISSSIMLGEWKTKTDYKTKEVIKVYNVDTDAYKKLATDCVTKALSNLGFNADVFLGKFDDARYTAAAEKAGDQKDIEALKFELSDIQSVDELMKFYYANIWVSQNPKALKAFGDRKKELTDEKA